MEGWNEGSFGLRVRFRWMFIRAAGIMIGWDYRGMYSCGGLPTIGLHVCASIVYYKFYSYVASLSGPNDHSPIYTACYVRC